MHGPFQENNISFMLPYLLASAIMHKFATKSILEYILMT